MLTRQSIALALAAALLAPQAAHADSTTLPDALEELERQADELLGPDGRRAVERLLPMIETLLERLPIVIENMPDYEMPEIMPNGDIIIRRKRKLPKINPDAPPLSKDGIKT